MSQYRQSPQFGAGGTGRQTAGQGGGREFPTASHLSADVRRVTVERLTQTLADLTVLRTQAKYAHWNVKGMAFYGLHDLFDDLAERLSDHVDAVAERITALGGQALGTAGQAVASCRLPAMPTDAVTGQDFVDVMTERLSIVDANLDEAIEAATDTGDVDTADLLNEVSRDVSTYRWFVEAHLQTEPIGATGTGRGAGQGWTGASGQQPASQFAQTGTPERSGGPGSGPGPVQQPEQPEQRAGAGGQQGQQGPQTGDRSVGRTPQRGSSTSPPATASEYGAGRGVPADRTTGGQPTEPVPSGFQ